MSGKCTVWAWAQSPPSSSSLLVLLGLADMSSDGGQCWPSQPYLAGKVRLSTRATHDALKVLEAVGLIERTGRFDAKGRRLSDLISLRLSQTTIFADGPDVDPGDQKTKVAVSTPRDQPQMLQGDPAQVAGEPTNEEPSSGKENRNPPSPLTAGVERLWSESVDLMRKRSTRNELRDALETAIKRGASIDQISAALGRYLVDPEISREGFKYAKGIHRFVQQDRWRNWAPAEDDDFVAPNLPTADRMASLREDIGTVEAPGPRRQRNWMEDWTLNPGRWQDDWGPLPGEPGCRVDPETLRAYGVAPPSTHG